MSERLSEAIIDFANELEAAAVKLKRYIGEAHGVVGQQVKPTEEDFNKLLWERKTGTKGDYEQTSKDTNNNSQVFQALQAAVREKGGFRIISNYKYWLHQNDVNVIDRRRK